MQLPCTRERLPIASCSSDSLERNLSFHIRCFLNIFSGISLKFQAEAWKIQSWEHTNPWSFLCVFHPEVCPTCDNVSHDFSAFLTASLHNRASLSIWKKKYVWDEVCRNVCMGVCVIYSVLPLRLWGKDPCRPRGRGRSPSFPPSLSSLVGTWCSVSQGEAFVCYCYSYHQVHLSFV